MFRRETLRKIRRSDSTISLEGKRFEIPYCYKHLGTLRVRYAKWDLSFIHLVDDKGEILCQILPLDKSKNSSAIRKSRIVKDTSEDNDEVGFSVDIGIELIFPTPSSIINIC